MSKDFRGAITEDALIFLSLINTLLSV